ncbi:MAG: sodium-translocating pyrophosphatase [Flectobacillus sp.]|nr:sodium-translocating pyrophosphatase [Flectobacillus sp.]
MNSIIYLVPAMGIVGLLYTAWRFSWVSKQPAGNAEMQKLSGYIADGAIAFLKAEWKILLYFAIPTAILLFWLGSDEGTAEHPIHSSPLIAVAFLIGAFFSGLAGYIGMKIATKANVRTAEAARTSLSKALQVSFTGGSVMGMGVAGLAILGLGGLLIVFYNHFAAGQALTSDEMKTAIEVLAGFSLGAESIALFARVGGGIYTKAADVGADLVGKVEAGIPEDDVRNPATIADNVGDNVGDVAGMGADLFGSYVATILATMVLGQEIEVTDNFEGYSPILLPMLIAGVGLLASLVSTFFVRIKNENSSVQNALNLGNWISIIITFVTSYFLVKHILPETLNLRGHEFTSNGVFLAIVVGLVVGTLMSMITEYYTAMGKRPVLSIIEKSGTGHATNIIGGLAVGMESTVLPILILAAGIILSYKFAGLYGVSIAAAGMMATTAMQLAIDAFGPIADNAGGIAEMSQLPPEVRERTDNLDAVGNTTAATGKGFAIASAALTSLALFAAFVGIAGISAIDIYKADVLAGLFVGAMIPFIFSALCISAVGKAAMEMVNEVRRQFREIPGIMEYKAEPEYEKCVAISTQASIRQMILPGAIALITPVLIGFTMGPEVLGGLLAGVTVSGVLMGIFQSNAGGAWDNAKKSFEKGVVINGETYYKKSEPHKASVTGDTVGDPFKDTSGPSMNILIKLMSIVSLVIAPYIAVDSANSACCADMKGAACCKDSTMMHGHEGMKMAGAAAASLAITSTDGKEVTLENIGKIESDLVEFIKSDKAVDKTTWFDFDNLTFETGKAVLKPESQNQLKNIAEILKAYPKVALKLGGYTDNTGDANANLKLSGDRAKTVESELVKLGVEDARLEEEGYGQEHPIADNATEEGRAANRRISVRVTAK